ncbi:MAG: iron-sulfur cluster-binding domain-containing protein, partial [Thermoanaerobaculia bacterium]
DLPPGAYVQLGLHEGNFVLPEGAQVRPLFLTAGSGITPIMSMLRSLASRSTLSDVVHLHFAPRPQDVIFGAELARLAAEHPGYRLHLVTTRESASGESDARRHLTLDELSGACPDFREREAFACGPQGLLSSAESLWSLAGLPHRLHIERFRAAMAAAPSGAVGGLVRFNRSQARAEANGGTNLLRVAEEAGLAPAHGCRMGICHSCDVALLSGCVRDLRNNRLTDQPGTKVQLCVSAASGPVELDL